MNSFLWAISAAGIWGVVPLLEKAGLAKADPLVGLFYRCLGVVLGLVVLGAFMVKPDAVKSVDAKSAWFLIAGGFLASFVAQICFYSSLKTGEVSKVVPVSGSYPFIAFLLGVLIFQESFTLLKGAGVFLVVVGIWLLKIG